MKKSAIFFFNRIQWLLMINDIDEAKDCLQLYERVITKGGPILYFSLQRLHYDIYRKSFTLIFPHLFTKINALLDPTKQYAHF